MPSLPDHEMREGNLAGFAEVASVQSFPNIAFADQPLISSLLCFAIGHRKGTIALWRFSSV